MQLEISISILNEVTQLVCTINGNFKISSHWVMVDSLTNNRFLGLATSVWNNKQQRN